MLTQPTEVFVDFEKYCKTCKYRQLNEVKDPCNECLVHATNWDSEKPVHYESNK